MQMRTPPMVGVPAFFWCSFGALLPPYVLADLELVQLLNHVGADEQGDQQRRERGKCGAERQIPEDAKGSEVGKKVFGKEASKAKILRRSASLTLIIRPRAGAGGRGIHIVVILVAIRSTYTVNRYATRDSGC